MSKRRVFVSGDRRQHYIPHNGFTYKAVSKYLKRSDARSKRRIGCPSRVPGGTVQTSVLLTRRTSIGGFCPRSFARPWGATSPRILGPTPQNGGGVMRCAGSGGNSGAFASAGSALRPLSQLLACGFVKNSGGDLRYACRGLCPYLIPDDPWDISGLSYGLIRPMSLARGRLPLSIRNDRRAAASLLRTRGRPLASGTSCNNTRDGIHKSVVMLNPPLQFSPALRQR